MQRGLLLPCRPTAAGTSDTQARASTKLSLGLGEGPQLKYLSIPSFIPLFHQAKWFCPCFLFSVARTFDTQTRAGIKLSLRLGEGPQLKCIKGRYETVSVLSFIPFFIGLTNDIALFRSARASCTTSGQPVHPYACVKNLDTYIQAYMPHESSGDSSNQPIGHMGSPRRLP